jgi:hypothetical protein
LHPLLANVKPQNDVYDQGFLITKTHGDFSTACKHTGASLDTASFLDGEGLTSSADGDPETQFQHWIVRPPNHVVACLVGPPLKAHDINGILSAGPVTSQRPSLPGINEPYWYLSQEAGTPAPLHIEDAGMGSANLLLNGATKDWLIVCQEIASRLEECLKKVFHAKECSQFVRHLNLPPLPSWLREHGIRFEIVRQNPGEVMCTLPGPTYHAVRNIGKKFAIAINYEYPGTAETSHSYKWCKKGKYRCGKLVLTQQSFLFRREVPRYTDEAPLKSTKSPEHAGTSDDKAQQESIKDSRRDTSNTKEPPFLIEDDSDDGKGDQGQQYDVLRLPAHVSQDSQNVKNILNACMSQSISLKWFGCQNTEQLRAKLWTTVSRLHEGEQQSEAGCNQRLHEGEQQSEAGCNQRLHTKNSRTSSA